MTDIGRRKNTWGREEKGTAPIQEDARASGKSKENHVTWSTGKPGEGVDMGTEVLTDESLSSDFVARKWLKRVVWKQTQDALQPLLTSRNLILSVSWSPEHWLLRAMGGMHEREWNCSTLRRYWVREGLRQMRV